MKKKKIDVIDIAILNLLMKDAWRSNKAISEAIGLSEPATLVRVQNLKERGFISKNNIQIDVSKFGYNLEAAYLIQYLKKDEETIIERVRQGRLVTTFIILKGTEIFAFNWMLLIVVGKNKEDLKVASQLIFEDIDVFFFSEFAETLEIKCNEFSLKDGDIVK